jgi:hypothetical protein
MGTEKDIFGKAVHYSMGKEDKPKYSLPKKDEASSETTDYVMGKEGKPPALELNLERRVGETRAEYHLRLFAIRSTQISLIENYEHEISLDRYRSTDKYFKILLEDGDEKSEKDSIQTILNLQKEVKPYLERDSAISYRKSIDEKLKDLKSLL